MHEHLERTHFPVNRNPLESKPVPFTTLLRFKHQIPTFKQESTINSRHVEFDDRWVPAEQARRTGERGQARGEREVRDTRLPSLA